MEFRNYGLITLLCCLFLQVSTAQVGIGTSNPNASSILDIVSNDQGVLFPRIDLNSLTTAAPVDNPATGLVVWNTDLANSGVNMGMHYWDGTKWQSLVTKTKLDSELASSGTGGGWAEGGNTAGTGDFIGTTNYVPLEFRTNNKRVGFIQPVGGIALGKGSAANENRSIAIGVDAKSDTNNEAVAIGSNAEAVGYKSTAIGAASEATNNNSIAIGTSTNSTKLNSTALGNAANSTAQNATAIGHNAVANKTNTVILGDNSTAKVGIGTSNPTEKLQVNGKIKMVDGTQGAGKVLTSDADGVARWVAPSDVKYFAEVRKSSNSEISASNSVTFGITDFEQGITANSNNFQTQNVAGTYRVSFKITLQKNNGGKTGLKFFLAKNYSSGGLVLGSEVYTRISNGEKVTIYGEKLVQLGTYEAVGVYCDTSASNIQILSSGTTFSIELVSE